MTAAIGFAGFKSRAVGEDNYYTVTERSNLRKSPSVEGLWIMTVPEGAQVRLIGGEKDGYTLVEYEGTKGYVYADQLLIPGESSESTAGKSRVITAEDARDMAMNAAAKRKEQAGEIALDVSSSAKKQAGMIRVATGVNFREGAGTSSARISLLKSGDVVEFLDAGENGFLHVRFNGVEGYALASCLEHTDLNPGGRDMASASSLMSMQQIALIGGEGIQGAQTVTTTAGSAMKTEKTANVKQDKKQISYQIGVKTSMRSMPDESDDLLATLPAGTSVMLLGEQGGYAMVQYDGMVGYVLGDDLMNSVEYARLNGEAILFTVTGYCSCHICCGIYSPEVTGREAHTATGTVPAQGRTIAVDPKVIPYGSHVTIEGLGTFTAEDCGGGINNNHIDLYFENHADAIKFGKQQLYATVN